METLDDFFRALDHFIGESLGYMADGLFGSHGYREGFFAGIVLLVLIFGLAKVVPWAIRLILVFGEPSPPSLTPGDSPVQHFVGCLGGTFVMFVLTFLFLGMIWGLT